MPPPPLIAAGGRRSGHRAPRPTAMTARRSGCRRDGGAPGRVNLIGTTPTTAGLRPPDGDRPSVHRRHRPLRRWRVRAQSLDLAGTSTSRRTAAAIVCCRAIVGTVRRRRRPELTGRGRWSPGSSSRCRPTYRPAQGCRRLCAVGGADVDGDAAGCTLSTHRVAALGRVRATGVPGGLMDRSPPLRRPGTLLIDCRSLAVEPIPLPDVSGSSSSLGLRSRGTAYAGNAECGTAARLGVATLATFTRAGRGRPAWHVVTGARVLGFAGRCARRSTLARSDAEPRASVTTSSVDARAGRARGAARRARRARRPLDRCRLRGCVVGRGSRPHQRPSSPVAQEYRAAAREAFVVGQLWRRGRGRGRGEPLVRNASVESARFRRDLRALATWARSARSASIIVDRNERRTGDGPGGWRVKPATARARRR
jgi:hypothetical protein